MFLSACKGMFLKSKMLSLNFYRTTNDIHGLRSASYSRMQKRVMKTHEWNLDLTLETIWKLGAKKEKPA